MSKFIIGKDRNQTEFFCVEQLIDSANIVRIIDLFVDSLSMKDMGFKTQFNENGRPLWCSFVTSTYFQIENKS